MRALELKIPPVLVVLVVGTAMWGAAAMTPSLAFALPFRTIVAVSSMLAGAAVAIAGVAAFRIARTTVDPTRPDRTSAIVTGGVYGYTRNPMYLGFLLVLIGWAVWLANPAACAGPLVFLVWMTRFQIIPEEHALGDLFGEAYSDYRQKVRRWL